MIDSRTVAQMIADYKAKGGQTTRCPTMIVAPTKQLRRKAFSDGSRTIN
jgi:hypothetical protein